MKYWAFISYTRADERSARALHQFLESYSLPRLLVEQPGKFGEPVPKRLYPVFLDRDELGSSASLPEELKERLNTARWLVVVCTRNTPISRWVREEVQHFISTRSRQRIICVFPDGIDAASLPDQLPAPLAKIKDMPLGVDLSGKENLSTARLRLVATLAGVEFAALQDRDTKRKKRRLAATAGSVVLTGAALTAFVLGQQKKLEETMFLSALSNAGLPASADDVASLAADVRAATSPIVSWRGRRFLTIDGLLTHAPALDDTNYVFDPASEALLVLNKEGEEGVSFLDFPSLDTVIGQVAPADGYRLVYHAPAIKLDSRRYVLYAHTQSSSAGGAIPALVFIDGYNRQVSVFGLHDVASDMLVSADCTSFALRIGNESKPLSIGRADTSIGADDWRTWDALDDPKGHACTNLLPIIGRDE